MKRILLALALAASLAAAAQDTKKGEVKPVKTQVQRLFILKYADPTQLMNLLKVFDAQVHPDADMHALAVEATPESMRAIEDAIQKLDVPSAVARNIEMTMYLLVASDSAAAGGAIPKDLDSVTTQLKSTFPFKNYGLLDVLTFRTRTGQMVSSSSSGGSMQVGNRQMSVMSDVRIGSVSIGSDGATVRIDKLNFSNRVPVASGVGDGLSYQNVGLQTDLDIKEGQKVVVGRLGITHDQAMFLVLIAKIL